MSTNGMEAVLPESPPRRGIIDATSRILGELLKKPAFKETLKLILGSIDEENAPELVSTLIWQDLEVVLSVVGALPHLANAVINILHETAVQMESFPAGMLEGLVRQIVEDVDTGKLRETMESLSALFGELEPALGVFRDALSVKGEENG